MHGYAFLALSVGLLVYVAVRLATPPPAPTTLAQFPAAPTNSEPRPNPVGTAQAAAPLDITPRDQQPIRQRPPEAKPAPAEQSKSIHAAETLTAAAVAALIVLESRRAYHAGGRPCACPDDRTRNGRSCCGHSGYSRPSGAAPLCYPSDVIEAMIKTYRERQLAAR